MQVKVTIQGVTPLLMNRFTEANEVKVSSGLSGVHVGGKPSPREQATARAYADEKGNLYIPGPNVFSCLIQAGIFHKSGKKQVTTQKSSLIPAGMGILDIVCPLHTNKFEVDSRSVVIPATGGRIMCHRPRLDIWQLSFIMDLDVEMFSPQFARLLVDDAGRKIGLGDFRPARKGPFGKFTVVRWEEI